MTKNEQIFNESKNYIPGGVNSPVRAFKSVGGVPPIIACGSGSKIKDIDGKEYVDCVASWGPLILGHAHPKVVRAIHDAAEGGTSFGAPTVQEMILAKKIVELVPSIEKVRLVNSGTEATMSAVRLARAATKRDKIIKFEGCYHGHADSFLIKAGSGALTLGVPSSPGVPKSVAADTLNAEYNNADSVRALFVANPGQISCVIVEPVAGNTGVVAPAEGFLRELREITKKHGALLIFDEVITGFRLGTGGAQAHYGVMPDLTTLGKIIGGGLPVGAYGGRAELMNMIAPEGPVYQAGTLSGNPIAVAAGLATISVLEIENPYSRLDSLAKKLFAGLIEGAKSVGFNFQFNRIGSMGCVFFTDRPVHNFAAAMTSDAKLYRKYHGLMLEKGVYLAPSQYEACFVSTAHTDEDIDHIINAAGESLETIKKEM